MSGLATMPRKNSFGAQVMNLFLAIVIWFAIAKLTHSVLPRPSAPLRVWWTSAEGKPPPDFRYLMFPATEQVPIYNEPGGVSTGTLTRALSNTEEELHSGDFASFNGGTTQWVRLSDLVFDLPEEKRDSLIVAWKTASAPGFVRDAEFVRATGSAPSSVRIIITGDGITRQWEYTVTNNQPSPLRASLKTKRDDEVDGRNLENFLVASGVATAVAVLFLWASRPAAYERPS